MSKENSTSIHIKDFQGVKIHSFVAPYEYAANATHIIETANELVIVDGQFITPLAQAFRGYVDSLKKPINRIFISHGHPDHYFGFASAFADQKGYSLEAVNKIIAEWGPQMITNQKPTFGDMIPDQVLVPQHIVKAGTSEIIDGLNYEFEAVEGAENEIQLLIKLPEIGVVIAQDLVYSGVHLWLGMGWFDIWMNELQKVADLEGYNYILPGHGLPCPSPGASAGGSFSFSWRLLFCCLVAPFLLVGGSSFVLRCLIFFSWRPLFFFPATPFLLVGGPKS